MIELVLNTDKIKWPKIVFHCIIYNHYYNMHKCNNNMLLLITVKIL